MDPVLTFLGIIFLNGIKPGPGIMFSTSLALADGLKPTLITALGTDIASFCMVLLLLLGSNLLEQYPNTLLAIQGAALCYVLWLGLHYFFKKHSAQAKRKFDVKTNAGRFIKGFLWPWVNPLNIAVYSAMIPYLATNQVLSGPGMAVLLSLATGFIYFFTRLPYLIFADKAIQYLKSDTIRSNMPKFTGAFCILIALTFMYPFLKKLQELLPAATLS